MQYGLTASAYTAFFNYILYQTDFKKEIEMGIQDWSENIILVVLPREPEMGSEINTVIEILRDRDNCDVVVDFSNVNIVTSSSLSKLLNLNKLLIDYGHRLIFCNVDMPAKRIFQVTGLDQMSEFADDRHIALASLQKETQQEVPEESQETALETSQVVPLERLWERNTKTNRAMENQKEILLAKKGQKDV